MSAVETAITWLARVMAILGGLALTALILITVVSVSGRALVFAGLGPVPGDFELVEVGTAFAVFSFLPWCHLTRNNASVDILTNFFSTRINLYIDVVVDILMFVIAVIIAWRHWLGTLDKTLYGETTFILQFPIWWAYAASMVGAAVFVIVAAWCMMRSLATLFGFAEPSVEGHSR